MADSTKAWERAFASGSKEMQNRLKKVHAKNPVFQDWLKSSGHAAGESVKQASKEVKQTARAKQLASKSITAYGAGGLPVGGEHGSGAVAHKSGAVKIYTPAEIEAINKERGTLPVELSPEEKRKNMIKAAVEKAAARKARSFDVPTAPLEIDSAQDLVDAHRSLHVEEVIVEEEPKQQDSGEYDYEGDMAMSQLKSIMTNAKRLHDLLEPNTNLPEWVQLKITLAEDYIVTASNYMEGKMNEQALPQTAQDPDVVYKSGEADIDKQRAYQRALEKQQSGKKAAERRKALKAVTTAPTTDAASRQVAKVLATNPNIAAAQAELAALSPEQAADLEVKQRAAAKIAREKAAREAAAAAAAQAEKKAAVKVAPRNRYVLAALALAKLASKLKPAEAPKPKPVAAPAPKPAEVPAAAPSAKPAAVPKPVSAATPKPAEVPAAAPKPVAAPAPKPVEVPVATPKPATAPMPLPLSVPVATTPPVPTPAVVPVPVTKPAKKPTKSGKPRPVAAMPGFGGSTGLGTGRFYQGTHVQTFGNLQYGEVPKSYEFTSEETSIDEKALPGLSNLPSAKKNKMARLLASKVSEEADDKYTLTRRDKIRQAIHKMSDKKNGK